MTRTILMLEQDEDDRYITQAYFDENQHKVDLQFVTSPDGFWKYLRGAIQGKEVLPSMVLLNYHAGPVTAVEILREIKANHRYRHIPVVVLSGSVKQDIIKECYREGANSFIQKPSTSQTTTDKISNFIRYWFETVELI